MTGPCAYHSPCQNPLPTSKDEFAEAALEPAPTNDSGIFTYIPVVSHILSPAFAPPFAPTKLVAQYTNANLQKVTKFALELIV